MSSQPAQASNVPSESPVSLSDLIGWIESKHNRFAIRFERGTFNAITNKGDSEIVNKIRRIHGCSSDTARMLYSTSYGEFQIMGFNLWGRLEYGDTFTRFLSDKQAQCNAFNAFVLQIGVAFTPAQLLIADNKNKFAKLYNGSLDYVKGIDAALKRYAVV